jgi:acetyl esterase/lipase
MIEQLPGRVTIENDVVFGKGGGRDLKCDIYHPPNTATSRPGLLLIHGGGWRTGDRSQLRYYGIQLARYGFVGVACEYRLTGEALWPAQIQDVKAALRWMRANAGKLGIDAEKICVTGNSAGAHLALMLGCETPEFEGQGGSPDVSSDCAAITAVYPPTNLNRVGSNERYGFLFGKEAGEEVALKASPIHYADKPFPPTLLIHGNADTVVPPSESFNMYEVLKKAGADVELHMFDGAPHAFDRLAEYARVCVQLMLIFFDYKVINPRSPEVPAES